MKTFDRRKDADKYRDEVASILLRGERVSAPQATTVRAVIEMYLRHCEDKARDGRIGKAHLYNQQRMLSRSIIPYIGDMNIRDIKSGTIEDLYQNLCRKDGVKPQTARHRIGIFKMVQDYAYKRGIINTRPVSDGIEELRGIKKQEISTFTNEEVAILLDGAKERKFKGHKRAAEYGNIFVHLAAFCGLRIGEIMGLTLDCIDFGNRMILVRRSLSRHDGLKAPKTPASIRDVPMPVHIALMLRSWLDKFYLKNKLNLVFTTAEAKPIDISGFHQALWRPLLARCGLYRERDPFHFHALRHFAASRWIDRGLPPQDVAALLGHSRVELTMRVYVHRVSRSTHRLRDAIDGMAADLLALPPTIDGTLIRGDATPNLVASF
ncbi:tyrosine-type recombinase/integrase [Methylobacterium indicum]|uniref:tyrosine-type recombinase/integrase n=1 Tax=Methylobacterium indicum TaxID=1775910 RepID=UPI0013F4D8E8|nr:tyrosine-type recombinase/integrase [Methylobacterium indicum]